MVSVLALNRLELREMINQEMIANPLLEEQNEEPTQTDNYSDETFLKAETEKVPEKPAANPFDEFDVGSFFNQYLDSGGDGGQSQEREVSRRPLLEKVPPPAGRPSDHLEWQLSVTICSDTVKEIAENIIGNLDENGYLTASNEDLLQNGKYLQDDLDDALAVVQDFDPIGVGARDLRECLLLQLKAFDPQNTLAQQIVSEHLKQVQSNQLKEVARALNRPLEVVKHSLDTIKKLDPRPGLRYNKTEPRLVEPDVYFRKVDDQWQPFLNEDDMPQLRLSPTYRRVLLKKTPDPHPRNNLEKSLTPPRHVMKRNEKEDATDPLPEEQTPKNPDATEIHLPRRTVAKYREDMRIPSTHQRREKN